jgi:hypothetical protein
VAFEVRGMQRLEEEDVSQYVVGVWFEGLCS